jgi:hypothetical protein
MRRLQHQFRHVHRHLAAPRSVRPHRWHRRFAAPPALNRVHAPAPASTPVLTGIHYMAMPDADSRDALQALVAAWRQAADAFGESMLQYAERRLFDGRPAPLPVPDTLPPAEGAPLAVRAVSNDELRQFTSPVVRIEVCAPDTLAGLGDLMVRWAKLVDGRAWDFIEIGCRRMLRGA